jgi:hypothetical protein
MAILFGIAATLGMGALWHGPLGAGERVAARIEAEARTRLDHYEMTVVQARLERGPLSRRLLLTGPADEFQRREIVRLVETVPGVAEARWTASTEHSR